MSLLEHHAADLSDAELIASVRAGNLEAYGDLFARHVEAANRLAAALSPSDADDLVSESFSKVLSVLMSGGGPDVAFRPYLLTAVRRTHIDRLRGLKRATPTDDVDTLDTGIPFQDTAIDKFEGTAAAKAFQSLPERWQLVLWHLEVEGQKPADVAPLLGMSANSVSALAYRAREGLRQAFLQMHAADLADEECTWIHSKLGAYVRQGLSKRDSDKVQRHLDVCRPCTAVYLELTEVNDQLGAVLAPLILGGATAAYLSTQTGGVAAGAMLLLGRARDAVLAHTGASAAAGAALTVGVVATVVGVTHTPAPTPAHKVVVAAPVPSPVVVQSAPPILKPRKPNKMAPEPTPTLVVTQPAPSPSPIPTPTPSPAAKPPAPKQSPSPKPAITSADVRVVGFSTQRQMMSGGRVRDSVRFTFAGIPSGHRARVDGRSISETPWNVDYDTVGPGCSTYRTNQTNYGDYRATCTVGPGDTVEVRFEHPPDNSIAIRIDIEPVAGLNDPNPNNNTKIMQL